jgi:hypothetical protein
MKWPILKDIKPGMSFMPHTTTGVNRFSWNYSFLFYEQSLDAKLAIIWIVDPRWQIERIKMGKQKTIGVNNNQTMELAVGPDNWRQQIIITLFERGIRKTSRVSDIPIRIG